MKNRQNWFPFLLINIFVSAAVTGAILFWYDRTYRQAVIPSVPINAAANAEAAPVVTLDPDTEILVDIVSVIGAGALDTEMVLVRYYGEGELDLTGWHLEGDDKKVYVFPQLTLYPSGAVQVHTAAGQDTVVDLYWGLRQSVWESGEAAILVDPQGTTRATYQVP